MKLENAGCTAVPGPVIPLKTYCLFIFCVTCYVFHIIFPPIFLYYLLSSVILLQGDLTQERKTENDIWLVAQSCQTLSNPMDCSLPGSSVHEDSPGKNTGVHCHALLQGIFPTQGSNPGLLCCTWILYWPGQPPKWYTSLMPSM